MQLRQRRMMNFTEMIREAGLENAEEQETRRMVERNGMILIQEEGGKWRLPDMLRKVIGPKWEEEWVGRRRMYMNRTKYGKLVIIGIGSRRGKQEEIVIMNEWGTYRYGKQEWERHIQLPSC